MGLIGIAAVVLGGLYYLLRHINYDTGKVISELETESSQIAVAAVGDFKMLRLTGAWNFFYQQYARCAFGSKRNQAYLAAIGQLPRLVIEGLVICLGMGVLFFAVYRGVDTGRILMLVAFYVAASYRLLPSLSRIHYHLMMLRQGRASFEKLYAALTALPKEPEPDRSAQYPEACDIDVKDLSFRYRADMPWLFRHFNLQIKPCECVAFTGKTGAGKTTFADLLAGLFVPDSGSITSGGVDIFRNLPLWRSRIGYVPQSVGLFNGSIRDNIAFGIAPEEIDDRRVWEVLKLAQIDEFVRSLPRGLEELVGESGVLLSGGQRQRIGIARALYRNIRLLILDEATSALDVDTEKALVDALDTLRGSCTILVIAHRLSTIEKCDRVIAIGEEPIA
ncbi:MAG: ABC transporter ATP-binding protein [Victivallaceae bacterium]|nr:ABC transporter ATP-binding protein [Victivallaceae bacterium]